MQWREQAADPHELRPGTLETVSERYDFHGGVRGPLTAHFKVDPGNGDILFFGNDNGTITWYRADSRCARLCPAGSPSTTSPSTSRPAP